MFFLSKEGGVTKVLIDKVVCDLRRADHVKTLLHRVLPTKRVTCTCSDKPWITGHIKRLLARRQHAFKRGFTLLWKFYRNEVASAIKQAKKSFAASKLSQVASRSSSWYTTSKQLSGCKLKGSTISIPELSHLSYKPELVSTINPHFAGIAALYTNTEPPAATCFLARPDTWTISHQEPDAAGAIPHQGECSTGTRQAP